MHLGNGAITPECGVVAFGLAAISTGMALYSARKKPLSRETIYTAGALGAAVFAAQMFNVQVLPFSSVHLIGGVLLAWALGPAIGVLLMAGILTVQTLALGDGGLMALGVNIINMGITPALVVIAIRRLNGREGLQTSPRRAAAMIAGAAFGATLLGASLVVIEVALGRNAAQLDGWGAFAQQMLACHALFGLFEAIATVAIIGVMGGLGERQGSALRLPRSWAAAVSGMALLVAILSIPSFGLASTAPDGYESAIAAAKDNGLALGQLESVGQTNGLAAQTEALQNKLVTSTPEGAGKVLVTTLFAGLMAMGMAYSCSNSRSPSTLG